MSQQFEYSDLRIVIVIIGTLLLFYSYYYFAHSKFFINKLKNQLISYEIRLFLSKKILGFLILGIIPGVIYFLSIKSGLLQFFKGSFFTIFTVAVILVTLIAVVTYTYQKYNIQRNSLQMNIKDWDWILFGINVFGWFIYLCGYEFLFRGILLFECYNSFGFWPAIAINIVIYSAIHMVNGKDEALGALIFGTIACYFTLTIGTLLIPIVMHVSLSLFSDFFTLKLNPEYRFINKVS